MQVLDATGVVAIATGANHSLVVLPDATVRTWGSNSNGKLGDGTTIHHARPVKVASLIGKTL